MIKFYFLFLLVGLISCSSDEGEVNDDETSASAKEFYLDDTFVQDYGVFYHKEEPFTGTVLDTFENGELELRIVYLDGQENGLSQKWYANGQICWENNYLKGKKEGNQQSWWSNGQIKYEGSSRLDLKEGEQLSWHQNGVMAEAKYYTDGREDGNQKSWNSEGKLISNYTFKNGKRYGIVGRQDCYSVIEAE